MQFPSEMKAIRAFHGHRRFLFLNTAKSPTPLFSSARHFHSTPHVCLSQESSQPDPTSITSGNVRSSRQAWSIYNPIFGGVRGGEKEKDEHEMERDGSCGSGKLGNLSQREETHMGLSNEYANSGVKEENLIHEEETQEGFYGGSADGAEDGEEGNKYKLSSFNEELDIFSKEYDSSGVKGNLNDEDATLPGFSSCVNFGSGDGAKREGYDSVKKGPIRELEKSRMGLSSYIGENENSTIGKRYGDVEKVNSGKGWVVEDVVGVRKKGKGKINWVCGNCGFSSGQWWGTCPTCKEVGTIKQFTEVKVASTGNVSGIEVSEHAMKSWIPQKIVHPLRLTDVNRGMNGQEWRFPLSGPFGSEVARVLGGGLVPGSLILVGGDPGVGKSTLVLQIAALIADGTGLNNPSPVVYVSGEESVEQIADRADRMKIGAEELFLYSSTDIEDIIGKIQPLCPRVLIVDSIQTVYLKGVSGSPGGITQVKESTAALMRFAKQTNVPVLLIGHVNKDGEIAGPRILEHIVDVVLYMEGEKYSSHRLLRPVKNRFGSIDELGVFEMSESGLQAVSDPSEIFLSEQQSDSAFLAGLAVAVIMDGSRSFLIEIQALCLSGSSVSRHANGIQPSRADMIISVLTKQAGLMLQENAIFLNVVSGLMLKETAGDVAIAAAICSSFLEFPIPNNVAFVGEIGLSGELRSVSRMDKRLNTLAKLGYKTCVVPKSAEKVLTTHDFGGMTVIGCRDLKEVINNVFKTSSK